MVLLEKLNKLEATIGEQATILAQVQEATSFLEPNFPFKNKIKTPFCPTLPPSRSREDYGEAFLIPKGRWASIDYFMTLPFVANLIPAGSKLESVVLDNLEPSRDNCKLPNLHPPHVQKLVETYVTAIHPMHPVLEIATVERIKKELDEDGLSWDGETAIMLLILAIACVLSGQDSLEYHSAAKRRLGFAVDTVSHMSIQAYYLQGYYPFTAFSHLDCIGISDVSQFVRPDHSTMLQSTRTFTSRISPVNDFLIEVPGISQRTTNIQISISDYSGDALKWRRDTEWTSPYLTVASRALNL